MRYHEITEAEALTPLARRVERQRERERERRKREKLRGAEYKDHRREELIRGVALIKKNCQPYLSQVSDPMLLRRGVSRDYDADPDTGRPMFNKKSAHLAGRRPRGGQMGIFHTTVNKFFTQTFGQPFRNGIMTIGDQMHSSGFGIDVAVFPIGDFKFLWSPTVQDLNFSVTKWLKDADIEGLAIYDDDIKKDQKIIMAGIEAAKYQTTDLEAAIASKNEIMIWAKEYYTLDNNADRMLVKSLLK